MNTSPFLRINKMDRQLNIPPLINPDQIKQAVNELWKSTEKNHGNMGF